MQVCHNRRIDSHRVFAGLAAQDYIGNQLYKKYGVELVTGEEKYEKYVALDKWEHFFLWKRGIIETIIDQLKNVVQIEHTRHQSFSSFSVNLICGLIAYCLQPKKPSLLSGKDVLLTP